MTKKRGVMGRPVLIRSGYDDMALDAAVLLVQSRALRASPLAVQVFSLRGEVSFMFGELIGCYDASARAADIAEDLRFAFAKFAQVSLGSLPDTDTDLGNAEGDEIR